MAKYIIDIPDEKAYLYVNDKCEFLRMPISVGENENKSICVPTFLRITPYTESDRKAIENEVWELARIVTSMNMQDYMECFVEDAALVMTYQEAKARYETWKKEKEEIHVGDEVTYGDRIGVVVRIDTEGSGVNVVGRDGCTAYIGMADVAKTGRHFPDVKKLLERMKAE